MGRKRENAMSDGSAGYKAEDLRNIRSLPDNNEFTVSFDERRRVMRRVRKAGTPDYRGTFEPCDDIGFRRRKRHGGGEDRNGVNRGKKERNSDCPSHDFDENS